MIEKYLRKEAIKNIVYVFGAFLEVVGFGLLFAFDRVMGIIHSYPFFFSFLLVVGGYFIAVSQRK